MKIRQMFFPLMVFATFLLLGRWTGKLIEKTVLASGLPGMDEQRLAEVTRFDQPSSGEDSFAPMPANDIFTVPSIYDEEYNHQKNILIVGVNNLSIPQPKLEGIWLVLYLPDMPLVSFMPIYPTVTAGPEMLHFSSDAELASSLRLTSDGSPHPEFLKKLEEKGLWWTNYVVLDGTALKAVLRTSRSENSVIGSQMERGTETKLYESTPDAAQVPQEALLFQAQIIQELCHTLNLDVTTSQAERLIGSLDDHLSTDITPDRVIRDLKSMLFFGGGFICEFPSLRLDSGPL